jgi:excisionase family DNA binding protein
VSGPQHERPLLLSIEDARRALAVGRSLVKRLVATGEIRSLKLGSRRLIPLAEVERYVAERLQHRDAPGDLAQSGAPPGGRKT